MSDKFGGIKTRKFGIEIEMTGITRCEAAKAIQKVLGGEYDYGMPPVTAFQKTKDGSESVELGKNPESM